MKFVLQRVHHMPKELQPGILYVSEEFLTAAHLCACGCGAPPNAASPQAKHAASPREALPRVRRGLASREASEVATAASRCEMLPGADPGSVS